MTGAALGSGLIVDFSRYMNEIVLESESSVTVQPGIVLSQLNRELRKQGRYFPPDPSTADVTTLGGMVAVDSAGSRAVRVGSKRETTLSAWRWPSLEGTCCTSARSRSTFNVELPSTQPMVASFVEPDDGAEDRSIAAATAKREIVSAGCQSFLKTIMNSSENTSLSSFETPVGIIFAA